MAGKLCVYHGNCDDGFGSAYAVWKKFGDSVEFVPGHYHEITFPEVKDRDIFLVDFTYRKETILAFARQGANSITILDHHKSAQEELQGLDGDVVGQCAITAVFDMDQAGVGVRNRDGVLRDRRLFAGSRSRSDA